MKSNFTKKIVFGIFLILGTLFSSNISYSQCPTTANAVRNSTDITCNGLTDGTITVEITDGTPPFNFELFDNNIGSFVTLSVTRTVSGDGRTVVFSDVYSSSFQVVVFKSGCPTIQITDGPFGFVIDEPALLEPSVLSITPDCDNSGSGVIDLTIVGGTTPYSYLWSNGAITQDITGLVAGSYDVTITDANGCDSTLTNIIVPDFTQADAGPDQTICEDNTTLAGNAVGTNETGTWSIISEPVAGTAAITGLNNPTTTLTGLTEVGDYVLRWTITDNNGICTPTSNEVTITVNELTTPLAGADQQVCVDEATLAANTPAATETGIWTVVSGSGTFVDANNPTTLVTGLSAGVNEFSWTITDNNLVCDPQSDNVIIEFIDLTTADAGPDQTICEDNTTLAGNAVGTNETGTWSIISEPVAGTAAITGLNNPTTTLTGLTEVGDYVLRWTITDNNGICTPTSNEVTITVNELTTPLAGADQQVCVDEATLAANTPAATETGIWTVVSGSGTFVDANNPTTLVTGLSAGVNEFSWTITDNNLVCDPQSDNVIIEFIDLTTADAGPDQTICEDNTTLAGNAVGTNETGTWSIISEPVAGTAAITGLNNPTTTLTGLTEVGDYVLRWTITDNNGICTPTSNEVTITVNELTTPLAGADQQVCVDEATLAANTPAATETGIWTVVSGSGTFVDANNPTTLVTGLSAGVNEFSWTITDNNLVCDPQSDNVIIEFIDLTTADAGPDQTICEDNTTLAGNAVGTNETGTWSIISEPVAGTSAITGLNNPTTTLTGLTEVGDYVLRWTITDNNGICTPTSNEVTITVNELTTPLAGADQQVCVDEATLAANTPAATETGIWTVVSGSGTFVDANNPTTLVTGLSAGVNEFSWTITDNNLVCDPQSDNVIIEFIDLTTADAGPDQTICEDNTTLAGNAVGTNETGTWSIISEPVAGTSAITGLNNPTTTLTSLTEVGDYVLRWTITDNNGICTPTSNEVTITVNELTTPLAGADQQVCVDEATLAANGVTATETGTWTVVSGSGTFTDANDPTTLVTGLSAGVNEFSWTITDNNLVCDPQSDNVVIEFIDLTIADAGLDQTICLDNTTLAGNAVGTNETGTWTVISQPGGGAVAFDDANVATTSVTGLTAIGDYILRWTITDNNGVCTPTSDEVTITVNELTTPLAGADQQVCLDEATLAANTVSATETGTWTVVSGSGTFVNANDPTTLVTGLSAGVNEFSWTITDNNLICDPQSDNVIIEFIDLTTADAGPDQTICEDNTTLAGNAVGTDETGTWTIISEPVAGTAVITDVNDPVSTLTNLNEVGAYVLRWTITDNNGICTETFAEVTITVGELTAADAGSAQDICEDNTTLAGNAAGTDETGTWTIISEPVAGTAVITDVNDPVSTLTGLTESGDYILRWTITDDNGICTETTSDVTITVNQITVADAGANQNVCEDNTTLAGNAAGTDETGTWTIISEPVAGTAVITDLNIPTSPLTGLTEVGDYVLRWTITDNNGICTETFAEVTITVGELTAADAGAAQEICEDNTILAGNAAGTDETGTWSIVSEPVAGTAVITDPNNPTSTLTGLTEPGAYVLRWTITDDNGICTETTSDVTITVNQITVADAGVNQNVCEDNTTLAGNAAGTDETGTWTIISEPVAGTAVITDLNNPTSTLTGLTEVGDYVLRWTITDNNGICTETFAEVTITVGELTAADAGAAQEICEDNTILAGNAAGTDETGTWSIVSEPVAGTAVITDPNNPTSTLTGLTEPGAYVLRWTITDDNGICTETTSDVTITVNQITVADAGVNQNVCEDNTTLAGNAAGTDETGTWTIISEPVAGTAVITDLNDPVSTLTGLTEVGDYVLRWTITDNNGICTETFAEVTITVGELTAADAGAAQEICEDNTILAGNAAGTDETGTWSIVSEPVAGTAVITDPNNPTSTLTGLTEPGAYVLRWTITDDNGICTETTSDVTITVNQITVADAGVNQNVCEDNTTLAGNAAGTDETGTWTIISEPVAGTAVITDLNDPVSTLTGLTEVGDYVLRWTITDNNGICTETFAEVTISLQEQPDAGSNATAEICNTADEFDLLAAKGDGDNGGVWNDLDGSGVTITGNLADFTGVGAGVYNFEYVVGAAPCTPDDAILTVTVIEQLTAGSNDSTQICVETASLDLLVAKGDGDDGGIWEDTDASGATITGNIADFTGIAPGFYQFTYEIGAAPCAEESAILVVEILAEPDAGSDGTANVCNNTDEFDLLAAKGDGDDGGLWDDTDASGATITGNLADFTGVIPGTYNFTYIIDNGLCSPEFAILTVTVGELVVTADLVQPVNCGENGTITLNITTGTADVIVWLDADDNIFDDGDGNGLVLSAPAGTYSVMVSDQTTTCMYQETFVITDPATFTVDATITDQTTCDVNDGSIELTLTPPSATATFVWTGPGIDASNENNENQVNLAPGDYTVLITDGDCSFTDTYTIAPAESITATASNTTLATCGAEDGTITIDVTQIGTNPYDIIINDEDNNFVAEALNQDGSLNPLEFNGLGQGNYNIIVKDNVTNCELNLSVFVNEDAPFTIDNASIINITTCDAAEGAISLTISGASGTETISWAGPDGFTASTQNIANLVVAGTYTVTIVDGGCTVTASYQITEPTDCDFDCVNFRVTPLTEAASCFGVEDGKIFFLLTNVSGNSPLKFSVKPAGAADTDYVEYFVNNLGSGTIIEIPDDFLAGQYNVIVEDVAFACVSNVINVNIGTKSNITDNISVIQPTCEIATGTITVTLSGTADTFTFELYEQSDLGTIVASNTDGVFSGLAEGIYTIRYVNDNPNGCSLPDRQNIQIETSNAFVATASDKEDVTCFGAETGSVVITVQGAASAFYSIDNGTTWVAFTSGNRISNLPAINNMLVSDEPGTSTCEVSLAVNILHLSQEIQLNGPITLITEASCTASEEIGEIRVPEVTGGVAPYIYFIDNEQVELSSDRTIGGLSRNVTNLIIIDNAGCIQSFDISAIVSPNEVRATVTEINPENNCVNDPEGIEIVIDQNTIDNVPGPYGLIINKVSESETTEFVLDINTNGSNTFVVGPGRNLDFTFEKGVRYRWTIRSISNDQACSADNFITINGGAIIPTFTVEGINVACFGESGSIILENIVVDTNLPLIVELYQRDGNSAPTTFNVDELGPNGRFIINNNNSDRIERGDYEVRIVQLNLNCPTLLIASELLQVSIDAPTRQLQAELVPEPNLPPGVERARSEMNPMPTTRPDIADGSISVRLTTLTGATGYSARIFLLEPMGGNNTSQYSLPQQPVPFNSSQTVTFDNLLPGIYEIEYYDAFGCGLSGNRLIFGADGATELVVDFDRSPFIPNVFTPNNDGVNDFFEILNLPDNGAELVVTNRNGAIVYRNNSYRPSDLWDGGEQPDGIYFYQLKINDTVENGWVEILRGKGR